MIIQLDHIGVTVPSLLEARNELARVYPCLHTQFDIATQACFTEVSMHAPSRLSISLHRKHGSIDIELMEYPRVSGKVGSALPWEFRPGAPLPSIKADVRKAIENFHEDYSISRLVSLVDGREAVNAVIVPVLDPITEQAFWESLCFKPVHADPELVVLGLRSPPPTAGERYVLLPRVDYTIRYFTDLEGINEIALLCSSCSAALDALRQATFRTSVSQLTVAGKSLDIGYVRSPAGVLIELFSVNFS